MHPVKINSLPEWNALVVYEEAHAYMHISKHFSCASVCKLTLGMNLTDVVFLRVCCRVKPSSRPVSAGKQQQKHFAVSQTQVHTDATTVRKRGVKHLLFVANKWEAMNFISHQLHTHNNSHRNLCDSSLWSGIPCVSDICWDNYWCSSPAGWGNLRMLTFGLAAELNDANRLFEKELYMT